MTKAATLEVLLALGSKVKELEIEGLIVKIRPLTWVMERDIAGVVGAMRQRGEPDTVCNREYVKLVTFKGLVEPSANELAVELLRFDIVRQIADAVVRFTGGLEKKE